MKEVLKYKGFVSVVFLKCETRVCNTTFKNFCIFCAIVVLFHFGFKDNFIKDNYLILIYWTQ